MGQIQFDMDGESLITPMQFAETNIEALRRDSDPATSEAELALLLAITQDRLRGGSDVGRTVDYLFQNLHRLRATLPTEIWRTLARSAQNHSVSVLLQEDPFTRWSFEKPRGYSGDARLLDFIYRHPSVASLVEGASSIGREIYAYTSDAPAAAAVRERREILASTIDTVAAEHGGAAEILTLAGGHLREAEATKALADGRIDRWVVLDQDPTSVGCMVRDHGGTAVDARNGSVKGLIEGNYDLGTFDCVYAAGLYDYLPKPAAVRLTRACLAMLKPGGLFLFANFARDIVDDGYMETFMDWPLLLRSRAEMQEIVEASAVDGVFENEIFFGANRNIIYGTCRKRG